MFDEWKPPFEYDYVSEFELPARLKQGWSVVQQHIAVPDNIEGYSIEYEIRRPLP